VFQVGLDISISATTKMQNEIIELSDSDTDTKIVRPAKKESTEISHRKSEVAALKAKLAAQGKLVAEQGKELNKLRKENKQFKNERDIQVAEITGLQDELKNILQQLGDETVCV
jgi:queuine/archaeosine tRNA-ribosyltransferase